MNRYSAPSRKISIDSVTLPPDSQKPAAMAVCTANNPMLTRNDFAQILYTALKNGATKNPALNKDNGLNRLASEFRVELKNVRR